MDRKILIYKSDIELYYLLPHVTSRDFSFFFYDIKVSFSDQGKNKYGFLVFSKIEKKKKRNVQKYIYICILYIHATAIIAVQNTVVRIILILKKDLFDSLMLFASLFEPHLLLSFISPPVVATAIQ